MWERNRYSDCVQEASRNGYHTWSVYAQGSTQACAFQCIARLRHAVAELRRIKPLFRKSLRHDPSQYLSEVATQAAMSSTRAKDASVVVAPKVQEKRGSCATSSSFRRQHSCSHTG